MTKGQHDFLSQKNCEIAEISYFYKMDKLLTVIPAGYTYIKQIEY